MTARFSHPDGEARGHRPRLQKKGKTAQSANLKSEINEISTWTINVMLSFFRAASSRQQGLYALGKHDLAGRFADRLEEPAALLERVERVTPTVEREVAEHKSTAASAADWERYATFELEPRDAFIQLRDQAKAHTQQLMHLSREISAVL